MATSAVRAIEDEANSREVEAWTGVLSKMILIEVSERRVLDDGALDVFGWL